MNLSRLKGAIAAKCRRPSTPQQIGVEEENAQYQRRILASITPKNVAPRRSRRRKRGCTRGVRFQRHLSIGRDTVGVPEFYEDEDDQEEQAPIPEKNNKDSRLRSMIKTVLAPTANMLRIHTAAPISQTPEPSQVIQKPQLTDNQSNSQFISKLPPETRQKIYRETIGGYMMYIRFQDAYRRLTHSRCRHIDIRRCELAMCKTKNNKQPGAPDHWGQVNLLALLKTCRIIYSEAIDILYKDNCFHFKDIHVIVQLAMTILPERMNLIKNTQWRMHTTIPPIFTDAPWAICVAPDSCTCVRCMSEDIYTDWKARYWVFLMWLVPDEELHRAHSPHLTS